MNIDSEFVLRPGIAQKLEFGINRSGGDSADVEWLSKGGNFRNVCLLARGEAVLVVKTKPIVHLVVNIQRHRTAYQAIDATGRQKIGTTSILDSMPIGQGSREVELHYFCPGRNLSDFELVQEFQLRGLEPDPQAQAADNEAQPEFAKTHPNGLHWKDSHGEWCHLGFYQSKKERLVGITYGGNKWSPNCYFAGVPKSLKGKG